MEIRYDKRSAAGAALLGLTLLGAVLVAIHPGPFQVDSAVLHGLIGTRSPALTGIVDDVSRLLSPVAMAGWTALIVVALIVRDRSVRRALPVAGAVAIAAGLDTMIKLAVTRPRPPAVLQVGSPESTYSYPSGHVCGTTVLVMTLLAVTVAGLPRARALAATVLAVAVIVLCAWTRLYLGAHWLSDVTGGALLGLSAALAVPPLLDVVLRRVGERIDVKGLL
ncbi:MULTISPECIES: phosphatase PAP2 family protein [Gordonia]|uniref:phosphatase PAP2 family protein n=1 Tax=Gordonia TaxID=2053 RepID=UPI0025BBB458|nr:phosphatase PAP2 family protein [Gordonia sp. UBA5067]